MSNTQKLDNDVLMSAVLFANQCVGVVFAPYQLELVADVLRGNVVPVDRYWFDQVKAYYHGAMLGCAAAKQQQSGQVEEARTTAMDVVAVHDEYERLAAIGYAAEKTTYDKINDTRHYPWDNLMPHVQSSKLAFTRAIIAELATKTNTLPTANDFLAVWAPKFGVTVGGRADTAAQLVQTMVAPVLAAKDAATTALQAQVVELQAKLAAADPTPTEDDEVKYAAASLLDEAKFISIYQNMSRKGLIAAVLNLSHDANVIASQRDRMMNIPSASEALNAVRNRIINELDNKRDDVGHYRVREVDVVKVIDEAIGAPWWAMSRKRQTLGQQLATLQQCGFCSGSGRRPATDNSKQRQTDKYDVIEKDPAKRAELVAACLNERGVLRGHGHPEARTEFVNGYHMVRFTARVSSIVDLGEQDTQTILKLALDIEESDEAYRRGRELMQQSKKA